MYVAFFDSTELHKSTSYRTTAYPDDEFVRARVASNSGGDVEDSQ